MTQTNTAAAARSWKKKPEPLGSGMEYGKKPPQAIDLEKAVLGAIMLERGAFDIASEILSPNAFYDTKHQRIYEAMLELQAQSRHIDLLTVVEQLRRKETLELIGGPFYVTQLSNAVVSSAHLEDHAKIIQERHLSRELIRLGGALMSKGYDDAEDAFNLLDFAEGELFNMSTGMMKSNYYDSGQLTAKAINQIAHLMHNQQDLTGVPTGYRRLDALTGGWQPTDLIIIAARPSVGKTAFALNLAANAARHPVKPTAVGIFSLEMSKDQLMMRMISAESKVGLQQINRGRITPEEYATVAEAAGRLAEAPIFIDDSAGLNVFELRAKARRMVNKDKVGLIIVDYLQLMSGLKADRNSNREQEISTISRSLKALAKELNVPIIALSQLSRQIESRKGGEPQLSDLRESGAIEQDADMVTFLTRPDYQQRAEQVDPALRNDAEVKIKKHRNGALHDLAFKTDLSIQRWYDLEDYEQANPGSIPAHPGSWRRLHDVPAPADGADDLPF